MAYMITSRYCFTDRPYDISPLIDVLAFLSDISGDQKLAAWTILPI